MTLWVAISLYAAFCFILGYSISKKYPSKVTWEDIVNYEEEPEIIEPDPKDLEISKLKREIAELHSRVSYYEYNSATQQQAIANMYQQRFQNELRNQQDRAEELYRALKQQVQPMWSTPAGGGGGNGMSGATGRSEDLLQAIRGDI